MTGPPGAGKSTVAATIARDFDKAVYLHTDDFWDHVVTGAVPPYLPESESQNATVMAAVAECVRVYADGGYAVVVDGVIGPWMLHHFSSVAAAGSMQYLVLRPSRAVTLSRATCRSGPGDLVDPHPVAHMWNQFRDLGDLERYVLDTTSQTPDETVRAARRLIAVGAHRLSVRRPTTPPSDSSVQTTPRVEHVFYCRCTARPGEVHRERHAGREVRRGACAAG